MKKKLNSWLFSHLVFQKSNMKALLVSMSFYRFFTLLFKINPGCFNGSNPVSYGSIIQEFNIQMYILHFLYTQTSLVTVNIIALKLKCNLNNYVWNCNLWMQLVSHTQKSWMYPLYPKSFECPIPKIQDRIFQQFNYCETFPFPSLFQCYFEFSNIRM